MKVNKSALWICWGRKAPVASFSVTNGGFANFEDAMDGDNNFRFIGTTGQYYTTIDTVNKTITLE